jgi:hypothetical protein
MRANNNVTFDCKYHVVWCPKYRRDVLVHGVDVRLKQSVGEEVVVQKQQIGDRVIDGDCEGQLVTVYDTDGGPVVVVRRDEDRDFGVNLGYDAPQCQDFSAADGEQSHPRHPHPPGPRAGFGRRPSFYHCALFGLGTACLGLPPLR